MEIKNGSRKKSIKVWVSDEERILLDAKAEYYGYKKIGKYVRDATIYEKVTYIDWNNRKEIYDIFSENTKEINKVYKEIKHLNKYATQLSDNELKKVMDLMYGILNKQKKIYNLIEKKMSLDIQPKINYECRKE